MEVESPSLRNEFRNGVVRENGGQQRVTFKRASRGARPSKISERTYQLAREIIETKKQEIRELTLQSCSKEPQSFYRRCLHVSGGGSKGPGIVAHAHQVAANHICSLKSKHVGYSYTEPCYVLCGRTTAPHWERLAECCLRSNAVTTSVVGRKKTEGSAKQTTRISCKSIGQAASAQIVAVAFVLAESRRMLRGHGYTCCEATATNAANVCAIVDVSRENCATNDYFCVVSTTELPYNTNAAKLTDVSVLSCARALARSEIVSYKISNAMGYRHKILMEFCHSILGNNRLDPVTYMTYHPKSQKHLHLSPLGVA
jgi:hypothetical protein